MEKGDKHFLYLQNFRIRLICNESQVIVKKIRLVVFLMVSKIQ